MKTRVLKTDFGFTLVEIMIVVAIIGILLGIGIPSFVKARRGAHEMMIQNNMRVLRDTVEQLAFEQMVDPVYVPLDEVFESIGKAPKGKQKHFCLSWPNGIYFLDVNIRGRPPIIVYWAGNLKWYSTEKISGGTFREVFFDTQK